MISRPISEQQIFQMPRQHFSEPSNLPTPGPVVSSAPSHRVHGAEGSRGESARAARAEITQAGRHSPSLSKSPSSPFPTGLSALLLLSKVFPLLTVSSNSLLMRHRTFFFSTIKNNLLSLQ